MVDLSHLYDTLVEPVILSRLVQSSVLQNDMKYLRFILDLKIIHTTFFFVLVALELIGKNYLVVHLKWQQVKM